MSEQPLEVHETAFVTSAFRASNEVLSLDNYAGLWYNKKLASITKTYLEQVSLEEANAHCLRNRYFLNSINKFIRTHKVEVLINFGSGFSMYPFLLDKSITNIEIDMPEVIRYKKSKINAWINSGTLPKRMVHFIQEDFSANYEASLLKKIEAIKQSRSSIILIEGVLFFLNLKQAHRLFDFFNTLQVKGDCIASGSFQSTIQDTQAYKNLLAFLDDSPSNYLTLDDDFYIKREGYTLIDRQDYFSLSKHYGHKGSLDKTLILNENFYILEKNA